MIELEFRMALTKRIEERYSTPNDRIIHELGIPQHRARVDIAVLGRHLTGFEIKTSNDTLTRLARQQNAYDRIFDRMYLAVEHRHVDRALTETPPWWGVIELNSSQKGPIWRQHRRSLLNPGVDLHALSQLLWRDEAMKELDSLGLLKGMRSASRDRLWRRLADAAPDTVTRRELHARLRQRLSDRDTWRVELQQA